MPGPDDKLPLADLAAARQADAGKFEQIANDARGQGNFEAASFADKLADQARAAGNDYAHRADDVAKEQGTDTPTE